MYHVVIKAQNILYPFNITLDFVTIMFNEVKRFVIIIDCYISPKGLLILRSLKLGILMVFMDATTKKRRTT
jgi:hypothetical protein